MSNYERIIMDLESFLERAKSDKKTAEELLAYILSSLNGKSTEENLNHLREEAQ